MYKNQTLNLGKSSNPFSQDRRPRKYFPLSPSLSFSGNSNHQRNTPRSFEPDTLRAKPRSTDESFSGAKWLGCAWDFPLERPGNDTGFRRLEHSTVLITKALLPLAQELLDVRKVGQKDELVSRAFPAASSDNECCGGLFCVCGLFSKLRGLYLTK